MILTHRYLFNVKGWIKDIFSWFILIYLLICFPTFPSELKDLDGSQNNEFVIYGQVPEETAFSIAYTKALEVWGVVTLGEPLLAYNLAGDPSVYIIPVRFGTEPFPDDETILQEIRNSQIEIEIAGKELSEIRKSLSPELDRTENELLTKTGKTFISINEKLAPAKERLESARDKKWGIGNYGFIAVSASWDKLPIQEYSNTLPLYYTRLDYTASQAKKALGDNVLLTRVFYAGPMDQMFEFSAGDKKIWISPFHGTIHTPGSIIEDDRSFRISYQADERIKKAWQNWLLKIAKKK